MKNQMQATLQGRVGTGYYRNTARIVGVIYLVGMVVGIAASVLIQSILDVPDHLAAIAANSMPLAIGATLWLIPAVGDAAHGILMFPILKQHNERIAFGYLASRIVDAVFVAFGVVFVLLQIPLGREYLRVGAADSSYLQAFSTLSEQAHLYAYEIGMTTVGIAGLMLCYSFFRTNLVPRTVAVWGLVGYTFLLFGSALQVLGFDLALIHTIPGGLWEVFMGVWLIAKGFNSPAIASDSVTPEIKMAA